MRPLKVRQGVTAGLILSGVLAATVSAQSADPLPTFAYILGVCVATTALAAGILVALNRGVRPPDAR